jgi:hypothetical protein
MVSVAWVRARRRWFFNREVTKGRGQRARRRRAVELLRAGTKKAPQTNQVRKERRKCVQAQRVSGRKKSGSKAPALENAKWRGFRRDEAVEWKERRAAGLNKRPVNLLETRGRNVACIQQNAGLELEMK